MPDVSPAINVSAVSDVEGNWEYFERFVQLSEAVSFAGGEPTWDRDGVVKLELADGWHLVHGGDCADKGGPIGGTVRVARSLVDLKKRYPDRVTLILGNRDLNKIRMTSELAPAELEAVRELPGPHWVPESKRETPLHHLKQEAAKALGKPDAELSDDEIASANTLGCRLRWMLQKTMGAGGEFERRRGELGMLRGVERSEVDTAEVEASFVDSVSKEGGFMREYMQHGQLAAVIGDALYVHGGVVGGPYDGGATSAGTSVIGSVPGAASKVAGVKEWVAALNAWLRAEVGAWIAAPTWDAAVGVEGRRRGGAGLLEYVTPNPHCPPSVVYAGNLDKAGMPSPLPTAVGEALLADGIRKLVVGHLPHGNCPTLSTACEVGVDVLMLDTSYSDMSAVDQRGIAVSEAQLRADGSLRVHGVLQDGAQIQWGVGAGERGLIGRMEPEGMAGRRFVKAKLASGDYLLSAHEGFKVTHTTVSKAEAESIFGGGEPRPATAGSPSRSRSGTPTSNRRPESGSRRPGSPERRPRSPERRPGSRGGSRSGSPPLARSASGEGLRSPGSRGSARPRRPQSTPGRRLPRAGTWLQQIKIEPVPRSPTNPYSQYMEAHRRYHEAARLYGARVPRRPLPS